MCMAIHIAADQPLSAVDWDEAHPAFYVAVLQGSDVLVRQQFAKAHVMYTGAHEGCGCGFQYGESLELCDPNEAVLQRRSLDQFAAYLQREVARVGPIELYACWEGDQQAPVEHRRILSPQALRQEDFFFLHKEFSIVTVEM